MFGLGVGVVSWERWVLDLQVGHGGCIWRWGLEVRLGDELGGGLEREAGDGFEGGAWR